MNGQDIGCHPEDPNKITAAPPPIVEDAPPVKNIKNNKRHKIHMKKKYFDESNLSEIPSNVEKTLRDLENDGDDDEYSDGCDEDYFEDNQDESNSGMFKKIIWENALKKSEVRIF